MRSTARALTQPEREAIAYKAAMDAAKRHDRKEHARLWRIYSDTCAQRLGAAIEAMEKAMQLK
jgi:hypothetical protein